MIPTAQSIIAHIPQWSIRNDLRATPLEGGMTNHNYRVDVGGQSFVLRIGGANREYLGIDSSQEYAAMSAAGEAGLAPAVRMFNPNVGYLVVDFVQGSTPSIDQIHQEPTLRRIVDLLDKVHRLPPIQAAFSPFRRAEMLSRTAQQFGVRFPDAAVWLEGQVERIETALAQRPVRPVLCHNDLGRRNFVDAGRLVLLDWEYAGMGDPTYDLANYVANQSSSAAEEEFIVGYYFGRISRARLARLRLLRMMSDYHEMLWCLVQSRISQHGIDFAGYAETNASFLEQQIRDFQFDQLLSDVTLPD